jgi:5-methyltetrahydrofolate--homocysteine methyltransferase
MVSLAREQVRDGSHVLDVNVDYAGRDNAKDMGEVVSARRAPGRRAAHDRLDADRDDRGGPQARRRQVHHQLANFEDGEEKFDEICRLAKDLRRRPGHRHDRRGQRRRWPAPPTASSRSRSGRTSGRPRSTGCARGPLLRPAGAADLHRHGRRPAQRLETDRGHAAHRRGKLPRCQITCGLSNVSFGLKPAARVVLNSASSCTSWSRRADQRHRARVQDPAAEQDRGRAVGRGAGPHLRPPGRSEGRHPLPEGVTDDFDPLQAFIDLFKDVDRRAGRPAPSRGPAARRAPAAPHHRRREARPHETLDEAMEKYPRSTSSTTTCSTA